MKIEGLEFLDWLHKVRKESEAERKRRGLSGPAWLREVQKESAEVLKRLPMREQMTQHVGK